jgi:probable rRNA maturation factor
MMGGSEKVHLDLDLQIACDKAGVPDVGQFRAWAEAALTGRREAAELTIRVVGEIEGTDLNRRYRGRPGPTNVLSFPFDPPPGLPPQDLLGDLVICAPLVTREAEEQGKPQNAHWAHLVVHGTLHLLGYDHVTDTDAAVMETLEAVTLARLGFPSPYEAPDSPNDQRPI